MVFKQKILKQNTTNIHGPRLHYINISDSQTITLPLLLKLNPKPVDFVTLHTPAIPQGASTMITVRVKESIKRMKGAGKFLQRWCQKNRTNILAIFEQSQAAPLEWHH